MKFKKKLVSVSKIYLQIILGTLITALAIDIFLVPFKIAPGGLSGIATITYYLSKGKIPIGVMTLILNVPLFIFGMRFLGKKFIIRTLFSTIALSLFIDASINICNYFVNNHLIKFENPSLFQDYLLYSIYGGIFTGLGLGIVFRASATTGGTDLAARIFNHFFPQLTMGQAVLLIDSMVIVLVAVSFNSVRLALYSILTLYISSKVIDAVLEGVNFAKSVLIISNEPELISRRILVEMGRGLSAFRGKGMYTGSDKLILMSIVPRNKIIQLKKIVSEVDKNAFIILSDVREVLGEGFVENI